jgi:adhesin/invasin
MRHLVLFAAAAAAVTAAACSGDGSSSSPSSPNNPTPTPTLYDVALDSGSVDSISVPAGSIVPVRVHVKTGGIPISAISVAWTVGSGHGALSAASTTTDTLGVASVLWTLGDTIGLNSITAVVGDGSVTWRIVGIAGAASSLVKVSADSDAVVTGGTLPLTARVLDRHGNPVAGAMVEWTSSGGGLSVTSAPSGDTGDAETNFTAPAATGSYKVTASLPGLASVTFEIVAM